MTYTLENTYFSLFLRAVRLYTIILLLCVSYVVSLAQGTNPFEIKERLGEIGNDTSELSIKAPTGNPFDVSRGERRSTSSDAAPVRTKLKRTKSKLTSGPSQIFTLVYSLIAFVLLAVAISVNRRQFTNIFKALVNSTSLKTLYRSFGGLSDVQMLILYVLFFSNMAFIFWLAQGVGTYGLHGGYLIFLVVMLSIYIIRHACLWLLGYVYGLGEITQSFNHSISIHNMVIGVVAMPFILSLGYISKDSFGAVFTTFLVMVFIIYFLRQLKGLLSAIGIRRFNLFYFFIYLCAFEIVPLLISWKVISGAL